LASYWDDLVEDTPFDVVFDCAVGRRAWYRVVASPQKHLVKPARQGGRFVAVVPQDWDITIKRWVHLAQFIVPVWWRAATSRLPGRGVPAYAMLDAFPDSASLRRVIDLVSRGELRVVVDRRSPYPFTRDGVVAAFDRHESRRAHGKVVIRVSSASSSSSK